MTFGFWLCLSLILCLPEFVYLVFILICYICSVSNFVLSKSIDNEIFIEQDYLFGKVKYNFISLHFSHHTGTLPVKAHDWLQRFVL